MKIRELLGEIRTNVVAGMTSSISVTSAATVDLEGDDGDKGTLPVRPRGHKATHSDLKHDVVALVLSEIFKGWIVDKNEAIAKREKKKREEKEATCPQFFDLTKKAIKVEETLAKTKAMEAEAKLLADERGSCY
jgi:hypothetical protein